MKNKLYLVAAIANFIVCREREQKMGHNPMADERRRNNPLVGGKQLLTWWMWILKEPTDREEKNPLG